MSQAEDLLCVWRINEFGKTLLQFREIYFY